MIPVIVIHVIISIIIIPFIIIIVIVTVIVYLLETFKFNNECGVVGSYLSVVLRFTTRIAKDLLVQIMSSKAKKLYS